METYQPTMSYFRPIMPNLPTYLKSDVINGRSLSRVTKVVADHGSELNIFGLSVVLGLKVENSKVLSFKQILSLERKVHSN